MKRRLDRISAVVARLEHSQRRLAELQAEVQEARSLHQRVAELTDVVAEVLLPAAHRDEERLRAALERFTTTSF